MSGNHLVRCYSHTAVIVRAAVEDMPGSNVRDADQWIVGRGLNVVSISCALRHPIEAMAGDCVRAARIENNRSVNDHRCPILPGQRTRVVELDVIGKVGEEYLTGGKHEHISVVRLVGGSIRSVGYCGERPAIPFEELRWRMKGRAGHHEHVAVRFERSGTIGDSEIARK